jgi:hypothetical protein
VSLKDDLAAGDRRQGLEALRDRLAIDLEVVDPRYRAPLAKQLMDVLKALDAIPVAEGSKVDELARRRAARRSGAKVSERSAGS